MEDLCTSCLCAGRKLYFLNETGFEHLYSQIINEIPMYDISELCIRICWECKALLNKVSQFKEQVKRCYMELLHYVQQSTSKPFPKFSHLQVHQTPTISYPQVDIKEEMDDRSYIDDDDNHFIDDGVPLTDDGIEVKAEETHREPETFVNNLNLDNIKEVKIGKKGIKHIKQKSKDKPKIKKQKGIKRKVKIKKKSLGTVQADEPRELTSRTVESLIDSTVLDCYKKDENRTEEEIGEDDRDIPDNVLENEMDKIEPVIVKRNGKIKQEPPKLVNESLSEKPVCAECGKTFSSRKTYRYHLNVLHKGQNRYPCPRCGKIYQWKSNLGRHMRSHKARDSGELYCETCDKRFASVATFRQHLRISRRHVSESEFSFMCNECGKKFVNKTRLRDHIDWEHLKKIKFKCQLCNKPFKCHTSLYVHMQNVHRSKDKKDNLCHVCGKSYQNAAKLKYHIVAMHTSETPYQCQQCNAAFGWYSSLYRHVREVHYKLKVQTKKTKKQKKGDVLPSLLPVLPTLHHPGHV